jgi:hypothetical protein
MILRATAAGVVVGLVLGAAAGCGSSEDQGSRFTARDSGAFEGGLDATFQLDSGGSSSGGDAAKGAITVTPANPVVKVTIDSTGVHASPVTFTAQIGSRTVSALWTLDNGQLGTLGMMSGSFSASGQAAGSGTISASAQGLVGSTSVTVEIQSTQNGGPANDGGAPEAGAGGAGGVGGEGLGGPVSTTLVNLLQTASDGGTEAGTSGTLSWLYPYDRTVWPRGLLAPLLQWTAGSGPFVAVYIHLREAHFEFQGFYAGTNLVHQPIDQAAWTQATDSNGGEPLHVEITLTDGTQAYGPIAEDWLVAPGRLKGTLYYSSYNTKLANPIAGETQAAAILAIQPGISDPQLAIPGSQNKCLVCHMVSGDGATLFASNGQPYPHYEETDAFDLRNNTGTATNVYTGNAPDGTTNDRKFLWAGLWNDATFALQSAGNTQEYYGGPGAPPDSRLFARNTGNGVGGAGFDGVFQQAVTPAFSPDGTKVSFNFWQAQSAADAGLAAGNGHTLDLMDFACGTPVGDAGGPDAGPSCPTPTMSGLRRLYTNTSSTGYPAWPSWLPNSAGIVFHNTVRTGSNSVISTWDGQKAQIWYVDVPAAGTASQPVEMLALDGKSASGASYLPTNGNHADDTILNYEPTVTPVVSGGYNWVVFTSRRMYGNVATGDPYDVGDGTYPVAKKLWVAAVDLHPTAGKEPSHPAFYLPAQEINAPNMRGIWVLSPCQADGTSCTTGDVCCGGYCRQSGDGGGLTCNSTMPPTGCSQEFEKCVQTSDCCDASKGYACINGHCAAPPPPM